MGSVVVRSHVEPSVWSQVTSHDRRTTAVPAHPKHRQIADGLRGIINRGELQPGDILPSEATLCEQYGVSRTTVRAALSTLANEGLVTSESGRGTFVRQRRHLTYRPRRSSSRVQPRPRWTGS